MKNIKLISYAILAVCWEQLFHHTRGRWIDELNPNFWVNEDEHTVSTILNGPNYVERTIDETKEILLEWITQWLKESKIVILYTCLDNAEIALDDPGEFTEDFSILDDPGFPELKGILYMAYDN